MHKFLAFCVLKALHFKRCFNWQPSSDLCCWYGPRLHSSFCKPCPQSIQSLSTERLCSQQLLHVEEVICPENFLKNPLSNLIWNGIWDVNGNIKILHSQPEEHWGKRAGGKPSHREQLGPLLLCHRSDQCPPLPTESCSAACTKTWHDSSLSSRLHFSLGVLTLFWGFCFFFLIVVFFLFVCF